MFRQKLAVLVAIAVAGLIWSGMAVADIGGSAHDFSPQGWSTGQICIVCHTPHNSDVSVALEAPLWNHTLADAGTFTMYSSTTLSGTIAGQPNTGSLLCLSCHDGVTALDSFGGAAGTGIVITGSAAMGQNLSNDHPISIDYTDATATADGDMALPETDTPASLGGGTTIQAGLLDGGTTLECAGCHDVHNELSNTTLLKIVNTGSALCLTCHTK